VAGGDWERQRAYLDKFAVFVVVCHGCCCCWLSLGGGTLPAAAGLLA
jgi:hypothetical protein